MDHHPGTVFDCAIGFGSYTRISRNAVELLSYFRTIKYYELFTFESSSFLGSYDYHCLNRNTNLQFTLSWFKSKLYSNISVSILIECRVFIRVKIFSLLSGYLFEHFSAIKLILNNLYYSRDHGVVRNKIVVQQNMSHNILDDIYDFYLGHVMKNVLTCVVTTSHNIGRGHRCG